MEKKILSYNVNGIRSALNKGLAEWLKEENPDIICIQETKAQPEQIDTLLFEHLGYKTTANSAEKKGYSGVAILSKSEPDFIEFGIGNNKFDSEGRVIRADFGSFSIICSYIPSGTTGGVRQDFKMEFLDAYTKYIANLKKVRPNLILSGDFNICHKPIDINFPSKHTKMSGFLPEEREWFDAFIESGMVDSFRLFNDQPNQYSWWSYRANSREKNLGWRIDYHLVSEPMKLIVKNAGILSKVNHSDHCPISILVDI
jgi:exodeoxyribonuclease III